MGITPRTRRVRGALVSAATVGVLFVLGEGVCRWLVARENRATLTASLTRPQEARAGEGQAGLADIIQLSPNDRIAYELRPNLEGVTFKSAPLTTDRHGFRSAPGRWPLDPYEAPGERTVVGIGDSILFGHGVPDGVTALDRLVERLNEVDPHHRWRAVNTAVPGYNTAMEVETLERKGLAFGPDLVLLGVCGNDLEPPAFVREALDPWDASRSFFLAFLDDGRLPRAGPLGLRTRAAWGLEHDLDPAHHAPDRYAGLHGQAGFEVAVDRLVDLRDEHAFELLAFAHLTFAGRRCEHNEAASLLAHLRQQGVRALDMQPILDRGIRRLTGRDFNLPDYRRSPFVVSRGNLHPSERMHREMGDALFLYLERKGVLEKLLAPEPTEGRGTPGAGTVLAGPPRRAPRPADDDR